MNALAVIRKLHMSDLLLPVGAALVTAGIEALAARERRQRDRLAALQASVSQHVDTLLAAGAPVPDELLVDEVHPFDAGGFAPDRTAGKGNPETSSNSYPDGGDNSSRSWKPAALALVGAIGIGAGLMWARSSGWLQAFDEIAAANARARAAREEAAAEGLCEYCGHPHDAQTSPHPAGRPSEPISIDLDELHETGETRIKGFRHELYENGIPAAPWDQAEPVKADLTPEPSENLPPTGPADLYDPSLIAPAVDALVDLVDGPDPLGDECGWKGCTWAPKETTRGAARVTALAVHRSKCPYRPPSMTVPGA